MALTVVHLGTQIQAVLGVIDENGNVVQKTPLNIQIDVLNPGLFSQACEAIAAHKAKMAAGGAGEAPVTPKTPGKTEKRDKPGKASSPAADAGAAT
jgi:hypothetical protein